MPIEARPVTSVDFTLAGITITVPLDCSAPVLVTRMIWAWHMALVIAAAVVLLRSYLRYNSP